MKYKIIKSTSDSNNPRVRKVLQKSWQRIKKRHDDLEKSKKRGEAMVRQMRLARGGDPDGGPYRGNKKVNRKPKKRKNHTHIDQVLLGLEIERAKKMPRHQFC